MTLPLYPAAFPGGIVRVAVRFADSATGALEPLVAPVTFIITAPGGAKTTGTATAVADGSYELSWIPTVPGRYLVYVKSSGSNPAVTEEEFVVRALQTVP